MTHPAPPIPNRRVFGLLLCVLFLLSRFGPGTQPESKTSWGAGAEKIILDNGLRLLAEHDVSSPITSLHILIRGGKRAEPDGLQGLAFLATRILLEVQDARTARLLVTLATSLSVTCAGEYTLVGVETLSENLDETLAVMSKSLLSPLFSSLRVDSTKKLMEHMSRREDDDSIFVGRKAMLNAFFGDRDYGAPVYGTEESRKRIKRKQASLYYQEHFHSGDIIISAVSDLDRTALTSLLLKHFSKIPGGETSVLNAFEPRPSPQKKSFIARDFKQAYVSIGFPLPALSRRTYVASELLVGLLGKGAGSRLWPLRQEKKLAYNVNCVSTMMQEAGLLEVFLETDNSKKEAALEALRGTLKSLLAEGLSEEELLTAKELVKAGFLRTHESKQSRSSSLAIFEALGLGYDFLGRFLEEVDDVSLEEMNDFMREVLDPSGAREVVVGKG